MESITLPEAIRVFGAPVDDFPAGAGSAFEDLIRETGDAAGLRNYYGSISFIDGGMVYYALAEEKFPGEGSALGYQELKIESGSYLVAYLVEWRDHIHSIRALFEQLTADSRVDKMKPAIEWYRNDDEMLCMVKVKD